MSRRALHRHVVGVDEPRPWVVGEGVAVVEDRRHDDARAGDGDGAGLGREARWRLQVRRRRGVRRGTRGGGTRAAALGLEGGAAHAGRGGRGG